MKNIFKEVVDFWRAITHYVRIRRAIRREDKWKKLHEKQ